MTKNNQLLKLNQNKMTDKLTQTPIPYEPTHTLYKGTSLEEKVMLIKYCHDPTWAIINYRHSPDQVKIMSINLTPIEVEQPKHNFWRKAGNYLLQNAPVFLSIIFRKGFNTKQK